MIFYDLDSNLNLFAKFEPPTTLLEEDVIFAKIRPVQHCDNAIIWKFSKKFKWTLEHHSTCRCFHNLWFRRLVAPDKMCRTNSQCKIGIRIWLNFRCNEHYVLIGSEELRCRDGKWSGSVPECAPSALCERIHSNRNGVRDAFYKNLWALSYFQFWVICLYMYHH